MHSDGTIDAGGMHGFVDRGWVWIQLFRPLDYV
jgi:hypothetical protein